MKLTKTVEINMNRNVHLAIYSIEHDLEDISGLKDTLYIQVHYETTLENALNILNKVDRTTEYTTAEKIIEIDQDLDDDYIMTSYDDELHISTDEYERHFIIMNASVDAECDDYTIDDRIFDLIECDYGDDYVDALNVLYVD